MSETEVQPNLPPTGDVVDEQGQQVHGVTVDPDAVFFRLADGTTIVVKLEPTLEGRALAVYIDDTLESDQPASLVANGHGWPTEIERTALPLFAVLPSPDPDVTAGQAVNASMRRVIHAAGWGRMARDRFDVADAHTVAGDQSTVVLKWETARRDDLGNQLPDQFDQWASRVVTWPAEPSVHKPADVLDYRCSACGGPARTGASHLCAVQP